MQPTCRHVPPRYGSFSTTTVFKPSSPARIAATYPPGPLPIIATSYFATRSLPSAGARTGESSTSSPQSHSKKARGGQADKTGRRAFALRTSSQTEKKPPALTAQTAASQQTLNFNSRPPPSQPPPCLRPLPAYCSFRTLEEYQPEHRSCEFRSSLSTAAPARPPGFLPVLQDVQPDSRARNGWEIALFQDDAVVHLVARCDKSQRAHRHFLLISYAAPRPRFLF